MLQVKTRQNTRFEGGKLRTFLVKKTVREVLKAGVPEKEIHGFRLIRGGWKDNRHEELLCQFFIIPGFKHDLILCLGMLYHACSIQ